MSGRKAVVHDAALDIAIERIVSFAAVIIVVTRCSYPTNGRSLALYISFLKLTTKDQASITWKPGPLAAKVTKNIIGAAANSYCTCMLLVLSNKGKGMRSSSEQPLVGEEHCVTTLITAAKETIRSIAISKAAS